MKGLISAFTRLHLLAAMLLFPAGGHFLMAGGIPGSDDEIEIIQVSIAEASNNTVELIFRLDEISSGDTLIIHRKAASEDTYQEIARFDVDDLGQLEGAPNHYLIADTVPEGIEPPYEYYLAWDDGSAYRFTYRHGTILLSESDFDQCTSNITLSWSHYLFLHKPGPSADHPDGFFTHYFIYMNDEEEPIGRVPVDQSLDPQTFTHRLEEPGLFRIMASESDDPEDPGRYSYSNSVEADISWPSLESLQLVSVSIIDDNSVSLKVKADGEQESYAFHFQRSHSKDDGFSYLSDVVHTPVESPFIFTDHEAAPLDEGIWYYRVTAYLYNHNNQVCDNFDQKSAPLSTIFLEAALETYTIDELTLEVSFDEDPLSDSYMLETRFPGEDDFSERLTLFYSDLPYTLNLSDEMPLSGTLEFRLRGERSNEFSYSNSVSIPLEPEVILPNALRPASIHPENRSFKPEFTGFSPENYRMRIFDRNGLEVFSTTDPTEGWTGTVTGRQATLPDGAYLYHITFTDVNGTPHERKGVVYLVL